MSAMKEGRKHYFDFLRGLAILMVVGIHTFPYKELYDFHSSFGSFCQVLLINFFSVQCHYF